LGDTKLKKSKFVVLTKKADEVRSLDNSFKDDAELKFTPRVNKVYSLTLTIFCTSPNAANFKWLFRIPAGATMRAMAGVVSTTQPTLTTDATVSTGLAMADPVNDEVVQIPLVLRMGSTPGDVVLQWAQLSSNAADTTVKSGSSIELSEELK